MTLLLLQRSWSRVCPSHTARIVHVNDSRAVEAHYQLVTRRISATQRVERTEPQCSLASRSRERKKDRTVVFPRDTSPFFCSCRCCS